MTIGVETPSEAKARGAFYTPAPLTRFLVGWAVRSPSDVMLEPSCGDGAFIRAAADRFHDLGLIDLGHALIGVEREPNEALRASSLTPSARIITSDFFDLAPTALGHVDAVVGNPPYIRYHGFTGQSRTRALARALESGVTLTRLASSWAPFVVYAASFLRPRGRLALVLPAELLHADYARPVREFLLRRFSSVHVVTFDHGVFRAQVDAILLLASEDDESGLRVTRVPDPVALESLDVSASPGGGMGLMARRWSRALDIGASEVYAAIERSGAAIPLGSFASVDIGFVSGADNFFVMSGDEADERGLPQEVLTPAIRRPRDVPGLLASGGEVRVMLDLAGRGEWATHPRVVHYLAHGVATGIALRYKCRTRNPWYAVPLPRRLPDAFIPYMSHHCPRLIVNDRLARSTNLTHGVSLGLLAPPVRALAAAMASSVTLLSAEIEGRSYGGGVLKLETQEAERLLVPTLDKEAIASLTARFDELDRLVAANQVERAARVVDEVLRIDHDRVWPAYQALRQRRAGLKARAA